MVVSLYVCEIPINVSKKDLDNIFAEIEGFKDSRIKITNDKRKIAFIDYETDNDAKFALETLQGFRFSQEDRGLIIKISDNTKSGLTQSSVKGGRVERNRRMLNNKKSRDDSSYSSDREDRDHGDNRHGYKRRDKSESSERYSILGTNNSGNYGNLNISNQTPTNNNKYSSDKATHFNQSKSLQGGSINENSTINSTTIHNFPINQAALNPNPNLLDIINMITSINPNSANQNTNKPYTLPEIPSSNPITNQSEPLNPINNIFECLQNLQTVQLLTSLASGNSNSLIPQNNPQEIFSPVLPASMPNTSNYNQTISKTDQVPNKTSTSSNFSNNFFKYDEAFNDRLKFKKNATNIVYVEGLPLNTTEREVAHIFRPFQGFKSVRLVFRDKNGEKSIICFADFENVIQSTICINTLQGYRFDKNDLIGLHFSYGVTKHK